ncbi:hypothetical protein PsYK624_052000 [Phanerochaete sordida]|uniref:Protein kinase domain-containing protein n=1 Tax=Phanerochaete sordida TaxID=48140 RepID=A0A9P3G6D9_9APHY|nr:hypothetical protein PsYK624_052000 [Phanerochaete sordida]
MPPPPLPLQAAHSSSSSPGATPTQGNVSLPATSGLHSKSDPALEPARRSPHVSITPPQRDASLAGPAVSTDASADTAANPARARGLSTSTIPIGSVSSIGSLSAVPMARVVSNPLPQPTSRASSPGRGAGRGRSTSITHADHSPPLEGAPSGSRSHSPLRDLARSWGTFRSVSQSGSQPPSQPVSPIDTRPTTTESSRAAAVEAEKKYWWRARADNPRPWFDEGEAREDSSGAGAEAPGGDKEKGAVQVEERAVFAYHAPGTPREREHVGLWHRKGSVPIEQSEGWVRTKQRVEAVTTAVLGSKVVDTALDVTREALEIGQDVLQFAPVAGLAEAARVLTSIWNAVQLVEFNRLQCLRLTERCANILLAVKEEVEEADRFEASTGSPQLGTPGKDKHSPRLAGESPKRRPQDASEEKMRLGLVGNRLRAPLERLIEAFRRVLEFLDRHNRRPFLKRYLKRDEILRDIQMCDTALDDARNAFEISVQVRILAQVMHAERQQQANTNMIIEHIMHTPPYAPGQLPPYQSPQTYAAAMSASPTVDGRPFGFPNPETRHVSSGDGLLFQSLGEGASQTAGLDSLDLGLAPIDDVPDQHPLDTPVDARAVLPTRPTLPEAVPTSAPQVRSTLAELTQWQNAHDSLRDLADLRNMLRRARDDDGEMARLLQVRPEEAPEALKALLRALEEEVVIEREEREHEERERAAIVHEGSSVGEEESSVGSVQGIHEGVVGRRDTAESSNQLGPSLSRKADEHAPEAESEPHRRSSLASSSAATTTTTHTSHDTLDREFMESVKASLVRLSIASGRPATELSLPSWTITRYEVDLERQVGHGSFSEVWRGRYRGRAVAVKVLQSWTPRDMFLREVHVWDDLRHPNVLEMVGASAVEPPSIPGAPTWPWFIVSRYYQRGSLVRYIQRASNKEWRRILDDVGKGVLRMIHEIVLGMEYLHKQGVLHGDMKCANVLVNDYGHCIISDFGQSEIKSEMTRMSGQQLPKGGTLRWQAPELMAGQSKLTQEIDVYAFAISCYEILTKADVPWPTADDASIRHFILTQNLRPELPSLRPWSGPLADIIGKCWALKPSDRPSFSVLKAEVAALRKRFGWDGQEQLEPGEAEEEQDWLDWIDDIDKEKDHKSPRLTPRSRLPVLPPDVREAEESFSTGSYTTALDATPDRTATDPPSRPPSLRTSMSAPQGGAHHPAPSKTEPAPHSEPGHAHPSAPPTITHSRAPTLPPSSSDNDSICLADMIGRTTPEPADPHTVEARNERKYRMILQHEFHPSLSLPLWSPSPVKVGAVGYHQKPEGAFVTLFDAFRPLETSGGRTRGMPSLAGYGNVHITSQRIEKRNTAQRALDTISQIMGRRNVSRKYTYPLRTGHKAAHLFTESATYQYVADPDLAAPRKWFQANVEQVLSIYGTEHEVQREDLMLVIGTLDAEEYALFVSHSHPDGEVDFSVFAKPLPGEPWGQFATTTDLSDSTGPQYRVPGESTPQVTSGSKVSVVKKHGEAWDTVLLARLRFLTDKEEPTSQ